MKERLFSPRLVAPIAEQTSSLGRPIAGIASLCHQVG